VISTDGPTTSGAGNIIYVNADNSFTRTSSTGFSTPGQYGEFTTDGTGSYTGWFITEPSGNSRFIPGGYIYIRVRLNDGAGGTSPVTYLTTADSVKVLNFSTQNSDTAGTGIYGNSFAASKDFAFLYDNPSGSGRPITGTLIENDGTANTTANNYTLFYNDNVNEVSGAWGAIIPNQINNGIRRIERRALSNGSIVFSNTDADGVWPSSANTVNPTGGLTPIVITSGDAPLAATSTLNLTALIEGFYNSTTNTMVPDTVKVELRNSSTFTLVDQAKVVLNSSGNAAPNFSLAVDGTNYYIVLKHRNSMETWSNTPQAFTGGVLSYDFTTAANKAYGDNMKQIDASPVKFGIFGGDIAVQDGLIDLSDEIAVINDANAFASGYLLTDLTGDDSADLSDIIVVVNNANAFISKQSPEAKFKKSSNNMHEKEKNMQY
jgi:hypothetical protein